MAGLAIAVQGKRQAYSIKVGFSNPNVLDRASHIRAWFSLMAFESLFRSYAGISLALCASLHPPSESSQNLVAFFSGRFTVTRMRTGSEFSPVQNDICPAICWHEAMCAIETAVTGALYCYLDRAVILKA